MTPFISSFRRQSHSKKEKMKNAGHSHSSSASSSSSTSASNARPSPSSSSSSFSVLLPQTPPEPISPMVEVANSTQQQLSKSISEVQSKPSGYDDFQFSGSGPFPVLANSRHSLDPHGLSRYLMNPEDPMLDYMYPVPLRSKLVDLPQQNPTSSARDTSASNRPDSSRRQSSFSLFGKKPSHSSSPLAGSSPVENRGSSGNSRILESTKTGLDSSINQHGGHTGDSGHPNVEAHNADGSSNQNSDESTTPTMTNRCLLIKQVEASPPAPQISNTVASSTRGSSSESWDRRTMLSENSTLSDATDTTDETKTPNLETDHLPGLLRIKTHGDGFPTTEPILDTSKERTPTVASKRPSLMSSSTWKTWLGVQKSDKINKEKLAVKRPKNLRPAPELSTSLSADPLSGTLPGSIPASTSTLVEEELQVPNQLSARDPDCVKAIHRMTLDKLHAIRAVNTSHPAAVDVIDKASYQRNLQLNPAIVQLASPRSSSPIIGIGSCIFPQADIFSIDVRLINILRKLDSRHFGEIQEIKHLSMNAVQSRREKEQRWSEVIRLRKEGQMENGIVKFVGRACFEDRMLDYDSDLQPRPVRAARNLAMLEPEYTAQTQGWVDLSRQNLLKRSERLGRFPESQSPVRRSVSRSRSTSSLQDSGAVRVILPQKETGTAMLNGSRSRSPDKAISHSASTLNLWAPTKRSERRHAPSDDEEDAESGDSEVSDTDDVPLSIMRRLPSRAPLVSSRRPGTGDHTTQMPAVRSRPSSILLPLTTPQPLNGLSGVATKSFGQPRKPMAEDPAKYRHEYLQVRDRIEKARKGETERERAGEAIRQRTQSATQKPVSTTKGAPIRQAAEHVRVETERKTTKAGSASVPTSPRRHLRQGSHLPQPPDLPSAGNARRPTMYGHPTSQAVGDARYTQGAASNSLARKSMSYADVRTSMGYSHDMPQVAAPFMNVGQPFMYVPVPMMPFGPMVNPFSMQMQMPAPYMGMQQPTLGQRRQSTMDLPRTAHASVSQQKPPLPRGGSRNRTDGREPVR